MRSRALVILAIVFTGCAADGRLEVDGKRPHRDPQTGHVTDVYTGETWPANPDRRRLNPDGTAEPFQKSSTATWEWQ